jgi:hypothetical protein
MKINHSKEVMRKKRKELVMSPSPLAPAVAVHVKTRENTNHAGMKRNLKGMTTHCPALSMAVSAASTKMKVIKLILKPEKKMVMKTSLV